MRKLQIADALAWTLAIVIMVIGLVVLLTSCQHQPTPIVDPDVVVLVGDAQSGTCAQACAILHDVPCPQDAPTVQRCVDACELAPLSNVSAFDATCVVNVPHTARGVRQCGARCLP